MTPDEYGQMLSETDTMIDRLHALYEQWFQGIERREPLKQRELIQKRLDLMRTSMPRNTALRFRSQNMIQRWVTMTHHWTKISRQIEEGTYKRDVLRARKRLEQIKTEEARRAKNTAAAPGASDAGARADAAPSPRDPGNGLGGWDLDLDDLDSAFDRAIDDSPSTASASTPRPTLDDEGQAAVVAPRFTSLGRPGPAVPPPVAVARPGAPSAPSAPSSPSAPSAPSAPAAAASAGPQPQPGGAPPPRPPVPPMRTQPKAPPPPIPGRAPGASPAPPVSAAPAVPPRPPVPVAPARPAAPAAPAASGAARDPDVRALYDRYVEARRQNNERVDNVRYESVAASIEKMIPELKKKHQGKEIDFEVVLKDGRVGFKPVAK